MNKKNLRKRKTPSKPETPKEKDQTVEEDSTRASSESSEQEPRTKKQKTQENEIGVKSVSINEINGRHTSNIKCETKGIVIAKIKPQERIGQFGKFKVSSCTIIDESGDSMDVKSTGLQAFSHSNKYDMYREIEVVFQTKNVSRADLRYAGGNSKHLIQNPVRITMTPSAPKTNLAKLQLEFETIEAVKTGATYQVRKANLCGIITEVQNKQFKSSSGLLIRINDETGTQSHVFYDAESINIDLIQLNEPIFILNANVQQKDEYVNSHGGIIADVKMFKTLKKQQKKLKQALDRKEIYEWQPKKYDFSTFNTVSVRKLHRISLKCKDEEYELKKKNEEIALQHVHIEFNNLCAVTYPALKSDPKRKKLDEEKVTQVEPEDITQIWKIGITISDEKGEDSVMVFSKVGDELMGITAETWHKMNETRRQNVINQALDSTFTFYLTLQKKEYQPGRFALRKNVVKVESE